MWAAWEVFENWHQGIVADEGTACLIYRFRRYHRDQLEPVDGFSDPWVRNRTQGWRQNMDPDRSDPRRVNLKIRVDQAPPTGSVPWKCTLRRQAPYPLGHKGVVPNIWNIRTFSYIPNNIDAHIRKYIIDVSFL